MSLRRKILIVTVFLLFITNGIAYLGIHYSFTEFIRGRFGHVTTNKTKMLAAQVNLLLDGYEDQLSTLASAVSIDSSLNLDALNTYSAEHQDQITVRIFNSENLLYPAEIATSIDLKSTLADIVSNKIDPLFHSIHISKITGDTVISVTRNSNTGLFLAMDFKLNTLFELLKNCPGFSTTEEAYLVNARGQMVSPSRFVSQSVLRQLVELPELKFDQVNATIYNNYLGKKVFGSQKLIPRISCILVNELPLNEVFRPIEFISQILFWTFLILFSVIFIVAIIGAQKITNPIKKLNKNLKNIEKGLPGTVIKIDSSDEIGDLARSFERMHKRINKTEQELKKYSEQLEEEVKKRTTELDEQLELLKLQKSESLQLAIKLEEINATLYDEISEREKAQKALKESEMRYRIVSDISSDYAYALQVHEDGSLINLWMTGAFEKMTGYSRTEIAEKGGWEFLIHPEDTAIAFRQVGIYLSGMPSTSEYRIISKSGEVRWVRDRGRPEWDADEQRVKYIYGATKDITLQREAQQELKNSERSYRELFDNNMDAIYIQDLESKFITVNKGAEQMYGYPKEFFIGKTPGFISAPDMNDMQKVKLATEAAFMGQPQRFEFWGLRKNGQAFPKEVHLFKGTYFGKEVIIAYAQDISSRKAAEAEVKRLTQAVDQSPISVVITDLAGRIEYTNREFEQSTGYKQAEIFHKELKELRAVDVPESIYSDIFTVLEEGHIWRGELLSRRKDGTDFWEETTISPVLDEIGKIGNFIAFKKDVTENKKLEEQFRQSQKMEAIGRLAGGVAHDFNNLLTVIIGYSELILSQIAEEDSLYNKIRQIDKAGRRAEGLTRQLLAFSRKQILQPKIINLNQMIGDMEKMLLRLIGEHIELQTILGNELYFLKADPGQIEQVIMNLSINARDAMPEGGKLVISTQNRIIKKSNQSEFGDVKPGAYVELTISDTGIGMDEVLKAQIFEPFFTTKEKGKGTGLGLSTVYGIIKQSNGNIHLDSEKGRGTSFQILFPQTEALDEEREDMDLSVSELKGTETLLLVEDEEALRAMAEETLKGAGYSVLQAENGEEALRVSVNFNQKIDLVLTDVVMPKMNGRKLAEEVVKIHPEVKVLFMSGYTDDAIIHHGVLDQNTEFIAKPFKPTALLHKIRLVLDQQLAD